MNYETYLILSNAMDSASTKTEVYNRIIIICPLKDQ